MVNNLDLSTLIAQIPEAQRLQHPQLISPEVQQALAQEMAQRKQRRESKQVGKSDSTAGKALVDPDEHRENTPQHFGSGQAPADEEPRFEPEQGRIIDTKV
jgi:hypothetical protein